MWIAKPLLSLSKDEIISYTKLTSKIDCPLSQTLTWAKSVESQGSEVIIAFDSKLCLGGFGFLYQSQIECINGPILDFEKANPQETIATFVYALTKAKKGINKVIIKPRLPKDQIDIIIKKINFPVEKIEWAATKIIIPATIDDLLKKSNSKFRNEYNQIMNHHPTINHEPINPENLKMFFKEHQDFLEHKKIFCPSEQWFKALMIDNPYQEIENIRFILYTATLDQKIKTNLLICYHGEKAYYLFGNEKRSQDAPNLSLNLVTQIYALDKAHRENIKSYDFNGFVVNCPRDDVYYGVNQFKKKFSGEVLEYSSPEFIFC